MKEMWKNSSKPESKGEKKAYIYRKAIEAIDEKGEADMKKVRISVWYQEVRNLPELDRYV